MDGGTLPSRTAALILLLSALLAAGCGGKEGAAVREYNRALAAWREGDFRAATASAERALAFQATEVSAHARFLLGCVKLKGSERAEKQAGTAEAEPFALQVAIAYAKKAFEHFRVAAMDRRDWPAARRNAERALLRIRALSKRKEDASNRKEPRPEPKPPPPPNPSLSGREPDRPPELTKTTLPPEDVRRLLERVAAKEREKRELRRAARRERTKPGERDW